MASRKIPELTILTIQLLDAVSSAVTQLASQLPNHSKIRVEQQLLEACRNLNNAIVVRKRLGGIVSVPNVLAEEAAEDATAQSTALDRVRALLAAAGGSNQPSGGSSTPPTPPGPSPIDG